MSNPVTHPVSRLRGATLVEMALVLLILGVLTRAAITPLTAAQKHRDHRLAESGLQAIRDGLWAHVVATGALPCPVALNQQWTSPEMPAPMSRREPLSTDQRVQSSCQVASGGVPARELGLAGAMDIAGALLDPWNRPYRLAISLASHAERGSVPLPDWTTPGEASSIGIAHLTGDLVLCTRSAGTRCPSSDIRANQLSFVVFSTGDDSSLSGDQSENQDADTVFVLQENSIRPDHPFDDQLVWGTAAETLYWMLRAGWLP